MAQRVLYISYDGMLEPLGQSQVIAYLERLAADYAPVLLSFEKKPDRDDAPAMDAMRARLAGAGIHWVPLAYHKSPSVPATAYDIAAGTAAALVLARRYRVGIVHARSYVPALMALAVKRATGAKFLFDMRGFWADERVDGGLWPRDGRLFRSVKAIEDRLLRAADHIVTLTDASQRELRNFPALRSRPTPITVIPTCADLELFSPRGAPDGPFTLGYVGQFGTWYLLDEMMRFFDAILARRPEARLLIVNRREHEAINAAAARAGIAADRVEIRGAAHRDVPAQIARMHAATALIAPLYSKISSAPTKLAEYLGCGVPCVGNAGVGDMAEILGGDRVGVVLTDFSDADHAQAADALLALIADKTLRARCVATAHRRFALSDGAEKYRAIYAGLFA